VTRNDLTEDFLLCNRCGACKAVCPVHDLVSEEWAAARGKIELAEAFLRGDKVGAKDVRRIYDLCLRCLACEDACPSGARAGEVITAVRAELARRGMIPRARRIALRLLVGMDNVLLRLMRRLRLVRKGPLHGLGAAGPLNIFFPLLGWPRQRFFPLPAARPFLARAPEFFAAADFDRADLDPALARKKAAAHGLDPARSARLVERFAAARARNREQRRSAYLFLGHAVNHFFPEEADALVFLLGMLGIDVHAPADQVCCGAPFYYAGDLAGARDAAETLVRRMSGRGFDIVVTSCASGGRMLRREVPRLLGIGPDACFEVVWDPRAEVFTRAGGDAPSEEAPGTAGAGGHVSRAGDPAPGRAGLTEAGERYRRHIEGRIFDINELLAAELGLEQPPSGFEELFGRSAERQLEAAIETAVDAATEAIASDERPLVTYHRPCHLGRGQGVDWQGEALLGALPGWRFVPLEDSDRCCGGGGAFTFAHPAEAEAIAQRKVETIAESGAEVVATACPVCRIQLMDMLRRRFELEAQSAGLQPRRIPVVTPAELLAGDLARILR